MSKKATFNPEAMGSLIDPNATPTETGIPQRGPVMEPEALQPPKEERRADMLTFKIKASLRETVTTYCKSRNITIAHFMEAAIEAQLKKLNARK